MTGPDGDRHRGWWRSRAVDPPRSLEFEDGFADADGGPTADMPTAVIRVDLSELAGGGTRMHHHAFPTASRWSSCSPWAWTRA